MPFYMYVWTDELMEYLLLHDVSADEFEEVVGDPDSVEQSRSSDRLIAFGITSTGKFIACVYEMLDDITILPVTAYEVED